MTKIVRATLGLPTLWAGPRIQMIQTIGVAGIAIMILFLSLRHLIFEFVSGFDISISKFKVRLNAQNGKALSSLTAIGRGLL